ncbi:GNAT family N-acetyltransferase [Spirochaeta africana]|uniref:Acetyltransferase n=1 Tax=Spirochaeta africana (strain ATCC 700263 / DSM 8902 / Z-7692) TaxID=889378 RepID=H9UHU7_SPIAZ|nr:GNAT family N-acetyltransferase [Spirochaeta africana]AFG37090.1 acetyltransferase [Spirochaeta africana DSM 8902]
MIFDYAMPDDYQKIKEMRSHTHRMHYENEPEYFKDNEEYFTYDYYKTKIDKNQIWKLVVDRRIIGYTIVNVVQYENHEMFNDQKILLIEEITIDKDYQRKGYGEFIITNIEKYAQENEYTSIELNVWAFNKVAIDFYKKSGMETSRIKMEKRL